MSDCVNHLLCYGKGADTVYLQTSIPLRPASSVPNTLPANAHILLAGGFTSILTDPPFPVSPTLQLNGDLSSFTPEQLTAIGQAELIRANAQTFRSYLIEPDHRVAVFGADAESLAKFVDKYGGILHLEPILLTEYDSRFLTAQDLEITYNRARYSINFMVRQAINRTNCTYCGNCGPACPEHCLSEHLFLDFTRCTLCKACEENCPEQAIDLHAVEHHEVLVPAIVLLEQTSLNLSSRIQKDKIFSHGQLEDLFTTMYAAQVDEVVLWQEKICQYRARLGIGCDACITTCYHKAITRDHNGITIDHLQCTECGECLSVCPTGALQYGRFTDAQFIEYFSNIALSVQTTIVLGREEDLHRFWWENRNTQFEQTLFVEYPQPSALSGMHLLFLFALGVARVIIVSHTTTKNLQQQVQLSDAVLAALFGNAPPLLITQLDALAETIKTPAKSLPRYPLYHDFSFAGRREKLADILLFFCQQGKKKQVRLTGGATTFFGELAFDTDKCTLCNACVGECKAEALTAQSSTFSILHKPVLCVQCASCVELCPEDALTLKPGLTLAASFFENNKQAQAEPVHCLQCGKIFGTRQSLARVISVLTRKNLWDSQDDLLQYCDTCRVVRLFEAQNK
jgi:ferredoxin